MIRKILIGVGIIILVLGIFVVYISLTTKSHSPGEVARFESNQLTVEVRYCRPFMKDRLIFGEASDGALVPYGQKWRTGANEATEIVFNVPIKIDGKTVPAGTYSLYTIPAPDVWQVAINERIGYWGASLMDDPFKEEYDVIRANAFTRDLTSAVEQFGISLQPVGEDSLKMSFAWDKTQADLIITY